MWWFWSQTKEKQQPGKVEAKKWIGALRKSFRRSQTSKQKEQSADRKSPQNSSSVVEAALGPANRSNPPAQELEGFQSSSSDFPPSSPVIPRDSDAAVDPNNSVSASDSKVCQIEQSKADSGSFPAADSSIQSNHAKNDDTKSLDSSVEILVRIPGSLVHLIDEDGSELLATGDFLLEKIIQNKNAIAVFARVGESFQWPVAKDEPTVKLDASHYFFSLQIPSQAKKEGIPASDKIDGPSRGFHCPSASSYFTESVLSLQNSRKLTETISYGVTFTEEGNEESLKFLDGLLDQYSFFSTPQVVPEVPKESTERDIIEEGGSTEDEEESNTFRISNFASSPETPVSPIIIKLEDDKQQSEQISTEYWTTVAPNVQQYNSRLAKAIATGSGQIIRGIFWCSDVTIFQLERGGAFMKHRLRQNSKLTKISPRTMNNIRRANQISRMSEKVAQAVLSGVVMSAEFFTSFVLKSNTTRKFVKLLPGEVALVSMDAYAKIFQAVELAGNNVLTSTSVVTSGVVSHRFGQEAAAFTQEGLAAAGHVFGAVWTISQIRNAFIPGSTANGPALMKSVVKAAYARGVKIK